MSQTFIARLNLAQCRVFQEKYADAIVWCQAALEIDSDSERGYEMMGASQLKLRELDSAEKSFQRLIELQPDYENGHLYLAELYQRQDKFPLAMQHYENVLRIDPRNETASRVLEALRFALGAHPN